MKALYKTGLLFFMLFAAHTLNAAFLGITSPTKDSVYLAGSAFTISYVFVDVDTINVEVYSPVNGGTWELVTDSFPTKRGQTIPIQRLNAPDWAFYQIRITDFNGIADTAYSGKFTILNPAIPTMQLFLADESLFVRQSTELNWHLSPSVDSIVLELFIPGDTSWVQVDMDYKTSDSSAIYTFAGNMPGGTYYVRFYDQFTKTYSNTDSLVITDNYFSGITGSSPQNGKDSVNIMLLDEPLEGIVQLKFQEPVRLNPDKAIDLYHNDKGLIKSFSTNDSLVMLSPDSSGDTSLLQIQLPLPLLHSSKYYILIDRGTVKDLAGNDFNGLQTANEWHFFTDSMYTFSGIIDYKGPLNGSLFCGLYHQTDIEQNNFNAPVNYISELSPIFPYSYSIGVPEDGNFGIYCFLDVNNNFLHDADEPAALLDGIAMNGRDSTGIDLKLKDVLNENHVFVLDHNKSFFGNNEPFVYNGFSDAYYAGGWGTGKTPFTTDARKIGDMLWKVDFRIHETNSDDLSGSVLETGKLLHLEYTYPDSLNINFIAAGGEITLLKLLPGRLILKIKVINPVESASGDNGAVCGFIISCSEVHTNGLKAYGSIFNANINVSDLSLATYTGKDAIGLRMNGKDGVKSQLSALLSDSFLVKTYSVFSPDNMPQNSNSLNGFIPGLNQSQYTVNNTFQAITKNFDIDGDGKNNRMYRVVTSNANWTQYNVMFGVDLNTGKENALNVNHHISYNQNQHAILSNTPIGSPELYDLSGRISYSHHGVSDIFYLKTQLRKGLYILRYKQGNNTFSKKLYIQ